MLLIFRSYSMHSNEMASRSHLLGLVTVWHVHPLLHTVAMEDTTPSSAVQWWVAKIYSNHQISANVCTQWILSASILIESHVCTAYCKTDCFVCFLYCYLWVKLKCRIKRVQILILNCNLQIFAPPLGFMNFFSLCLCQTMKIQRHALLWCLLPVSDDAVNT